MTTLALTTSNEFVSGRERLRRYVSRALARLRAQEALKSLTVVANLSSWLLALAIFSDRLFSLEKLGINVWIIWGALTALGIPYIIWRTYSPRIHANLAAVLADDRLRLHARLSSALTLDFSDPANQAFGEAFFDEALTKLAALKVEQAFPVALPRSLGFVFLPIAIAAIIFRFMPPQDALGIVAASANKRHAEALREKAGKELVGKLEDMKNKRPDEPVDEHSGQFKVNQLMQKADSIAKDMKDGKRTSDEALVALGQLKRDVEEEKEKLGQGKDFLDRLEKLSAQDLNLEENALTKEVSEALKMGDPEAAARQLRKLAQKVKDDILDDPNKTDEQKKQELDKLQREVEKLAGALAEDETLHNELKDLSQTMSKSDFQQLQNEVDKFKNKDSKNNSKKKLGDDIEKQMNDVADELERLDEENDEKLSDEEKSEKEQLENLEENANDAMEQLNGEEEGGEKEGQPKGQQPQQGQGQPGGGKSGKQKSGKGKSGQQGKGKSMRGRTSQQQAQGNQPGQQPGQGQGGQQGDGSQGKQQGKPGDGQGGSGQGSGKRPYRDGDAEFVSQKAKGQLQAGAITGLSHFRGQGAKGDAPQEFVKAITAAEQDAASSLELERIPVDARDTVKDYFRTVKDGAGLPATGPAPAPVTPPAGK